MRPRFACASPFEETLYDRGTLARPPQQAARRRSGRDRKGARDRRTASALIGLFWSEQEDSAHVWALIENYAISLVNKSIDAQAVKQLAGRLDGYKSAVNFYAAEAYGSPEKGALLDALIVAMNVDRAAFTDRASLDKTFSMFTVYGTLYLAALAERAFYYEQVFGKKDSAAALHLEQFNKALKEFTDTAQAMFDELYAWRFSQLAISEWRSDQVTYYLSEWTLVDRYDNFRRTRTQSGNGAGFRGPDARWAIENIYAMRAEEIRRDFVESLQGLLAVAQLWKYLDPSQPRPQSRVIDQPYGLFGGDYGRVPGTGFSATPPSATSRITQIKISHDAVVEGLEVFYDGVSAGRRGAFKAGKKSSELTLEADETIVEVSGRAGDFLDHVKFVTSKGRVLEGGGGTGQPFKTVGHESWKDAALSGVGGRADDRRIVSLELRWRHTVETEPYTPSYKRTGVPVALDAGFTLRNGEGKSISAFTEEYSGLDLADEYYTHVGTPAVNLKFDGSHEKGQSLQGGQKIYILTTEKGVGKYNYLSKFRNELYYYYLKEGDNQQIWEIVKMIPSDGPVIYGEKVYLRNVSEQTYMRGRDDGYLSGSTEPQAWTFNRL